MKNAALLLAAILLVSCTGDRRPAPDAIGGNYVETDRPWDDGQAK